MAMVVVAAGVTAGSASAVGGQATGLRLDYTCAFSSGSGPVSALVTATYPATGTAGKPIRPTGTGIAVTLPHTAVAGLARLNATTITLRAGLSIGFTEGKASATAAWRDLKSAAVAIPRTGPLNLTATGAAPPVTAAAGEVTVTVGDLSLLLTAHTSNGRPASPAATPVACVPRADQSMTLARITVTSAPRHRGAASSAPAGNPGKICLPFPTNLKLNPRFPLPKPPPGSRVFHAPQDGCSYAGGFANERKLHEAALVGPGLADLIVGQTAYTKFKGSHDYVQLQEPGRLDYHGLPELPPARNTFLGFGFAPVSATLQISEIGTLNASLVTCNFPRCPSSPPNVALFFARVSLSVSDVDVNGVPLDVGPHCRTATPFDLKLTGLAPAYNIGSQYGVLTGTVTVPPFTGCGVGENLDPIFDASVSGPGNFVKITQAVFCFPTESGEPGCPPAKPIMKH